MAGDDEAAIWHGGDLGAARRLFPDAPEPWIDLSTGINPHPYPIPPLPSALFRRLPSPADLAALEAAATEAYGAPDPAGVAAAPGTQILIELLPRLLPTRGRGPARVVVLGPTYAEHARGWRRGGHEAEEIATSAELAGEAVRTATVAVVVNPNNPDGRVLRRDTLERLARSLAGRGWLVVDEAFADLEPLESLAAAPPDNAVVLRSFGKAFGLAGLRLGFAVARPSLAADIRSALGPWAVSGPAIEIGTRALRDRGWRTEAARARAVDAERLDGLLSTVGAVVGGTRLFRLLRSEDAPALFRRLGAQGIWVRRFQADPALLRFGLPAAPSEWDRLADALSAI